MRDPIGGAAVALLHPALGFTGRPPSPNTAASRTVLATSALASIDEPVPPEPPVPPPEPPTPPAPPLPEVVCPPVTDVVGPLLDVVGPPLVDVPCPVLPPDDPVALVDPLVTPEVAGDDESEHAATTARVRPRTIEPKV